MTVRKLLKQKGDAVACIQPDKTLFHVLELLKSHNVGALVVAVDEKHVQGIISERDIVRGILRHGPSVLDSKVTMLMSRNVATCKLCDSLSSVEEIMNAKHIRHVPVIENGELCGIVSIRDVIKDQKNRIKTVAEVMKEYIASFAELKNEIFLHPGRRV